MLSKNSEKRFFLKVESIVDGVSGFLYLSKKGEPLVSENWQYYFRGIQKKYNALHDVPMPIVSPHVCRHTYCTRMAASGMNPKILQYLMGRSSIGVTMNVYSHIGIEDAQTELNRVFRICRENEKTEYKIT